jgi:hypothetical protein
VRAHPSRLTPTFAMSIGVTSEDSQKEFVTVLLNHTLEPLERFVI